MNKPELIVFDMDGLMIDTEPLAIRGWKIAAKKLNVAIPDDIYPHLIGLNRDLCKVVMHEWLGKDFPYEEALATLHASVDQYFEDYGVPIKPGLIQLLDNLDKLGIKKSVATSSATKRAVHKLTKVGIVHRFDAIIGGEQVTRSKPAPDIFLKAASVLNIEPKNAIVLEDSNPGAKGGYDAGMRVIVIPDLVPPSEITRTNAFAICEDLFQAWDIIKSL